MTGHVLTTKTDPKFRGPFVPGDLPKSAPLPPPPPPIDVDGGGVGGGTAWVGTTPPIVGSGGGAGKGTAIKSTPSTIVGTGGGAGKGTATVSYTPPSPTPGATCSAAGELPLDAEYSYHIAPSSENWFKLTSVTNGAQMAIETTSVSGLGQPTLAVRSGSCPLPTIVGWSYDAPDLHKWVNPTSGPIYIQISTVAGVSADYTIKVYYSP